jgi:type IV secretory pathway protease TraF
MSHDATDEARPVTSVELLNAAVWREIGWEEPQTPAAFVVGVVSGRLRINGTQSAPGIYWAIGKEPSKGDFVFALPPAEPVFSLKSAGILAQDLVWRARAL